MFNNFHKIKFNNVNNIFKFFEKNKMGIDSHNFLVNNPINFLGKSYSYNVSKFLKEEHLNKITEIKEKFPDGVLNHKEQNIGVQHEVQLSASIGVYGAHKNLSATIEKYKNELSEIKDEIPQEKIYVYSRVDGSVQCSEETKKEISPTDLNAYTILEKALADLTIHKWRGFDRDLAVMSRAQKRLENVLACEPVLLRVIVNQEEKDECERYFESLRKALVKLEFEKENSGEYLLAHASIGVQFK